jgi:YihY family inner membrane protein
LLPTCRYLMQTEVHVYAFSVAANVLLSFFPFLIVSVTLSRLLFDQRTTVAAIDFALRDYFPDSLGHFLHNNLPQGGKPELLSIVLLLFTANGIFEPLEVALNRAWGIRKNRSFVRNQMVSLALIFGCGSLALVSLGLTALNGSSLGGAVTGNWLPVFFLKLAGVPLSVLILFLVYRYLPNGKPPLGRVVPAAIGVGLLLEVLKYVATWVWPAFQHKLVREYGVFQNSVTLIFLSFIASLLVLAGAEWAARGHHFDQTAVEEAL